MFDYYFVIGKTKTGTVYTSKHIYSFHEACNAFKSCCDNIQYFGGGYVDLYHVVNDDAEIIEHKICT